MDEVPFRIATSRLLADLFRDTRRLIAAEIDLAREELSESRGHLTTGLAALVGGAAFLLVGLVLLLASSSLFLIRLGAPMDVAFLAVGVTTILIGWLLLWSGTKALQPRKLLPSRSLAQISSLLGRR